MPLHDTQNAWPISDVRYQAVARRSASADATALERIVAAAARSNGWAWTALMHRYGARVRRAARRYGLSAHDIEDVAQTTWLMLFEHIGTLREPQAVGSWLETTARRESLRIVRAGGRERPTEDDAIQPTLVDPVDEQRLVDAGRRTALQASLATLTERQCALMRSLLADPAPRYADVAQSLGMAHGSIGPTRQRCLDRLRADAALAAWCRN